MFNCSTVRVGNRVFAAALLLIACAAMGQPGTPAKAVPDAQPAPGAEVPKDWWAAVQKDIAQSEYNVTWQEQTAIPGLGSTWQAPNRAHDLRTYFTIEGPRVVRRTADAGNWTWGLELVGFGGADGPTATPPLRDTCVEGNRIAFERDGLAEWYVNSAAGLEQGFTIYQPPVSGDSMVLRLAVRGDVSANMTPDGQTVEFLSAGGVAVMRYGKFLVNDAWGRPLPATMTLDDGAVIELRMDAANAVYPVTIDPLATSAAWTAESNQAIAQFGASVATAGDVNGDGFSDVIVGAPYYDNGQTDEGGAFVYLGSASGLSAAAGWVAEGDQAAAHFGLSVSTAGDVNGDGYGDVIVGANLYDNGQVNEGRAFVYHGSPTGLSATAAWTAESNQLAAEFGVSVSTAGDVNGDGYSDVVVGAYNYDGSQTDEGRAYVYHGAPSGLSASPAWTAQGGQNSAFFGWAASMAGDVNGDGYGDVIVGAYGYDNMETDEGRAYVYHGSSAGLSATPNWTAESDQADAYFGISVATAGDVNGDGYADVILGASGYDKMQTDEGQAYVYCGSSSGLSATANWKEQGRQAGAYLGCSVSAAGDVNGDGYADVIVGAKGYADGQSGEGRASLYCGSALGLYTTAIWTGESDLAGAWFGASVATAGDVNGDGYADVIVGAPNYGNGQTGEGRASVYYGSVSTRTMDAYWAAEGDQDQAYYGFSVSTAGDVNGDGYADVIVGAYAYDSDGRVFVYHGSSSGLSTTADWTVGAILQDSQFGYCVSTAGDVNGDGYADVAVGVPDYEDSDDHPEQGRVVVYHGSAAGLSTTANWVVLGYRGNNDLGWSVSTAGDVNGDGYADLIVGAPKYSNGQTREGRAYVYCGSAAGLSPTASWIAESDLDFAAFGQSVSSAGDVNGDGYADVIVGACDYSNGQSAEGRAYVYLGSVSGLSAAASWWAEGNQVGARFGKSVSTAGDVNGDGYADVIVGAYAYDNGEYRGGRAYVYNGSASGLAATESWFADGNQENASFGWSVSTAGDVNGDGYADVIVSAVGYSLSMGRVFVFNGSASGLSAASDWMAEGYQTTAQFGVSVSTAGDVNGDGYADVIVGAWCYDNERTDEGRALLFYGNAEARLGMALNPRQRRGDDSAPLSPMGGTTLSTVRLAALGRTPFGCSKVKLECEVKPFGTAFNGVGTVIQTKWSSTGVDGAALVQVISGLNAGVHHWRARLLYNPAITPLQRKSRWFTMPWNGGQEGDFRVILPPTAPSNPGAPAIGTAAIMWSWTDNSSNETGFKVWADPGYGVPFTLRTTTAANVTSWGYGSLTPNTPYRFQVAAVNGAGDSAKTSAYLAYTLAAVPTAPTVNGPTSTTLNVAIGAGDGNPPTYTDYAIKCTTTNQWVQADGTLNASAVYGVAEGWGTVTVTGLAPATAYTFAVVARNLSAVETVPGPGASATTWPVVPNVVGLTQAAAEAAITGLGLVTGAVTPQCSNTVPAGTVISQKQTPGQSVAPGSAVDFAVSTGMCPVSVPKVITKTQAAASAELAAVGLTTGTVTQQCSDTVTAGLVISQDPTWGQPLPYGGAVALVV
jgi:hypothetical protein